MRFAARPAMVYGVTPRGGEYVGKIEDMGLPQASPRSINETCIRPKGNNTATRAHHLPHKTFLANPFYGFDFAVLVHFFDLTKLASRYVNGIIGFDNGGTEKLCLKGIKDIGWEATKLNAIQFMVRW